MNRTRNKLHAILSLVGAIIVLISFFWMYNHHDHRENKMKDVQNISDSTLNENIELKDSIIETNQILENVVTPPHEKIIAIGKPKRIGGRMLYDISFELKIDSIDEVLQVDYFFNHDSFRPKTKTSFLAKKNFKIEYIGWGCIDTVLVTIRYKSGEIEEIKFPMCRELRLEAEKL
jgi:hypothetical protein